MKIDQEMLRAARIAKEENLKKGLSYEDWRQLDNPGWYLSKEDPSTTLTRYFDYLKEYGFRYSDLNPIDKPEKER